MGTGCPSPKGVMILRQRICGLCNGKFEGNRGYAVSEHRIRSGDHFICNLYGCPFLSIYDGEKRMGIVKLKKSFIIFLVYVSIYFIGKAASVYSWFCMVIVIFLLAAASKFIGVDKKFTFFLGILFFSIQNISR